MHAHLVSYQLAAWPWLFVPSSTAWNRFSLCCRAKDGGVLNVATHPNIKAMLDDAFPSSQVGSNGRLNSNLNWKRISMQSIKFFLFSLSLLRFVQKRETATLANSVAAAVCWMQWRMYRNRIKIQWATAPCRAFLNITLLLFNDVRFISQTLTLKWRVASKKLSFVKDFLFQNTWLGSN